MEYLSLKASIGYGRQALVDLQNNLVGKFGNDYKLSVSELEQQLVNKNESAIDEIGKAVYASKFGYRRINESMERVVDKMEKPFPLPSSFTIITGITDELKSFDFSIFSDVGVSIIEDSVETLKAGTEAIKKIPEKLADTGEGLLGYLKFIVPVILLGAFFIWRKVK